jgi:hypothetical protein
VVANHVCFNLLRPVSLFVMGLTPTSDITLRNGRLV